MLTTATTINHIASTYTGPLPEVIYWVNPITGEIDHEKPYDNGPASTVNGHRWLGKRRAPGNAAGLFAARQDAETCAAPIVRQFAEKRAECRREFIAGFVETAAEFSDGFDASGLPVGDAADEAWLNSYETYPTRTSGQVAANTMIDASEYERNETTCPGGQHHAWSAVSHEEFRCRRCGEYKFVADL